MTAFFQAAFAVVMPYITALFGAIVPASSWLYGWIKATLGFLPKTLIDTAVLMARNPMQAMVVGVCVIAGYLAGDLRGTEKAHVLVHAAKASAFSEVEAVKRKAASDEASIKAAANEELDTQAKRIADLEAKLSAAGVKADAPAKTVRKAAAPVVKKSCFLGICS